MFDVKLIFKVEKKMKKIVGILMVMLLSVTLVACGGVDKQPAIDAFNNATSVYDALVNEINADISAYPQELIDVMMEMSEALLENKSILEGDQELTQEQIDAMIAAFGDVEKWAKETSNAGSNSGSDCDTGTDRGACGNRDTGTDGSTCSY